jgi:hypothetical protein
MLFGFLIAPCDRLPHMQRGDDMCFAGIEENVRGMLQKRELAEEIAAKAQVRALTTEVRHGHVHVLVEDQAWVRSVDLLEQQRDPDFEPTTQPVELSALRQASVSASR